MILSLETVQEKTKILIDKIRAQNRICKIFLLLSRSVFEVCESVWLGVDDFLEFKDLRALCLRIQLLMKRIAPINLQTDFSHNGFTYSPDLSLLKFDDGEIRLSKTERRILEVLFQEKQTVDSARLIEKIWADDMIDNFDRLFKRISVLKNKIRRISTKPLIRTIKGKGYRLF